MRPFLARFSEPVWSGHLASWADFITTTPELEFSVHTVSAIAARSISSDDIGSTKFGWASANSMSYEVLIEAGLVARFSQIEGYRCLSLTRAFGVVKCQLALA